VHGAQDSSSFILLQEHSKVFNIIYTNCPGNVCPGNVCPGKWLSGKRLVREIIDESGHANVRETSFRETSCPGNILSRKRLSRKSDCPGNVRYPLQLPIALWHECWKCLKYWYYWKYCIFSDIYRWYVSCQPLTLSITHRSLWSELRHSSQTAITNDWWACSRRGVVWYTYYNNSWMYDEQQ